MCCGPYGLKHIYFYTKNVLDWMGLCEIDLKLTPFSVRHDCNSCCASKPQTIIIIIIIIIII